MNSAKVMHRARTHRLECILMGYILAGGPNREEALACIEDHKDILGDQDTIALEAIRAIEAQDFPAFAGLMAQWGWVVSPENISGSLVQTVAGRVKNERDTDAELQSSGVGGSSDEGRGAEGDSERNVSG